MSLAVPRKAQVSLQEGFYLLVSRALTCVVYLIILLHLKNIPGSEMQRWGNNESRASS